MNHSYSRAVARLVAASTLPLCCGAFAATATFTVLLDTDASPATGCPVTTSKGLVSGVEQTLITTVQTTINGASVTGVTRQICGAGSFGAPVPVDPGSWPVGIGNGTAGMAVIETYLPLAQLGGANSVRLAVTSSDGQGGADAIIAGAGGAPILLALQAPGPQPVAAIQPIPMLHPLALLLLSCLLVAVGIRLVGRRGVACWMVAGLCISTAVGLAWAATVIRDGETGDWTGVAALATDSVGNAPVNTDLVALFGQVDATNLYLRIDADVRADTPPPPVNQAPQVNAGADQAVVLPTAANLGGTATDDALPNPPATLTYAWTSVSGPGAVIFGNANAAVTTATFSLAGTYVLRLTASDSLLSGQDTVQITVTAVPDTGLPPPPETVAPPISQSGFEDFSLTTQFLHTGSNPIQAGVAPGTIEPRRGAVIRGKVFDRSGSALSGAIISILNRAEFGQTKSRADGMYDMAVNGGGKLIVRVQKPGYFEVQRDVNVPWQDFVYAADVVLTPPDAAASVVNLAQPGMKIARGSAMSDASGARRATLLFPAGITAQFRMPNGSLQPAPTTLTVRQTEYTVGALGPQAMPSVLPPTSGYTYYLELTADEELAAGAIGVEFNQPVVFYLENFIGFPTGAHAPVGFYDRQAGVWKGEPDGRVVKVVSITAGLADLDTDGDGVADNGIGTNQGGTNLGVSTAERQSLATLYAAGQTLWRVQTTHFSPGDINWPFGPPPDAGAPNAPAPTNQETNNPPCDCPGSRAEGSIIEIGNQTLGEDIGIVGTGMKLHYRSDRVPGRRAAYSADIPLTGATVPTSLEATTLEINIAGQRTQRRSGTGTSQNTTFEWDGKDAYGRALQGAQFARIRVGFEYPAVYQATPAAYYNSWALASGNPIAAFAGRAKTAIFRDFDVLLGAWDARGQGLGGWTLSS
ncbi:MAG: hypothetical protein ABI831_09570, partial [Betaproteobacteria bacterium]